MSCDGIRRLEAASFAEKEKMLEILRSDLMTRIAPFKEKNTTNDEIALMHQLLEDFYDTRHELGLPHLTDGEGIERGWADLAPMASSAREKKLPGPCHPIPHLKLPKCTTDSSNPRDLAMDDNPQLAENENFSPFSPGAQAFIRLGVGIQQLQRRLGGLIARSELPYSDELYLRIYDHRAKLKELIVKFRWDQKEFMPQVYENLTGTEHISFNSLAYRDPEVVPIFLPSCIEDDNRRAIACPPNIIQLEAAFRRTEIVQAEIVILLARRRREGLVIDHVKKGIQPTNVELGRLQDRIELAERRISAAREVLGRLEASMNLT
ncbi:hypothetical protein DFH06DRAFT_1317079 [Mycena polygramma]|nr:hypothetical protein DFH06DRAFT_1317079 [Mycena polygramma]